MADSVKEEFPVLTFLHKLIFQKRAQRNATQNKRAGIEGHRLFSLVALLANQHNKAQLPQPSVCNVDIA